MSTKTKGVFLTIEGSEGAGKSTAVQYIKDYLTTAKKDFIITREPGGTQIAEKIRQILLQPNADEIITPDTELLLMFACRAQHIAEVILPALKAGKWVVSDRYVDASYAYQGGGRQMDLARIALLEDWIVKDIKPAVTILLDTTPEIGLARAKNRGAQDRIEQEKIEFFERVRQGYLKRAKADSQRFRIIDAAQPLSQVKTELRIILEAIEKDTNISK